ncbi:MAG: extensin family protein [Xanthomonadales bacterium]|nr:extensin family protein [Xanthomonadales bacterium]
MLLLLLVLAGATLVLRGLPDAPLLPAGWAPWRPLDVSAAPGPATRWQLERAQADAGRCQAALATSALRRRPAIDREEPGGCGYHGAVQVGGLARDVGVGTPFVLSCPAALDLAMWMRHDLRGAALAELGSPLTAIQHAGSYACRNIYGRADARRSRHATADALDVRGFVLADGRRIGLARDWGREDARGRFLRQVRNGACRWFDVVLGPDYNAAHHDHLHLEHGRGRLCR